MTKMQIVKELEKSNKIIDFDNKYLMKKSKAYLEELYKNIYCIPH